jgi:2-polyprenyl-3-methyl-5-hydroxy-6-metoxy-1,4-benzoquinol methylase
VQQLSGSAREDFIEDLRHLREEAQSATDEFMAQYGDLMQAYRAEISNGIVAALERMRLDVGEISGHNKICEELARQASEYVEWLQWSFWDLPFFAVATRPAPEQFRAGVVSCGMVYLSIRIFDDVLDQHFWYKGKRPTLLSIMSETHKSSQGAEYLTVLAGLLLCFEGLLNLTETVREKFDAMLRQVLVSIRQAILGAVMEQSEREEWEQSFYERLVELKNVAYWRSLYAAIDPEHDSSLYPFLEKYYALAQRLNDVQDFPEDEQRGQPNFLSLYLSRDAEETAPCLPRSNRSVSNIPAEAEKQLAREFLELGRIASELPAVEKLIARLKLGESLKEANRLGLFVATDEIETAPDTAEEAAAVPLGVHWHSDIDEVINLCGADALHMADCSVCGSSERKQIFQKQGFSIHRCQECSHIYVSPRIKPAIQKALTQETDEDDQASEFLSIQRVYAGLICDLLHSKAHGHRMLDIGFGSGSVMQVARSYGFEVYGIDSSMFQADRLWPHFGKHIYRAFVEEDEIPWDSFDVVVMSHVLEHFAEPATVLREVWQKITPGGLLYIAVPDTDSMQFRLFGKNWDVINPLAHLQYFNQASLSRLLLDCGYKDLERVTHPSVPMELAPRWMRLIRDLGGNDSGEICLLAYRPKEI